MALTVSELLGPEGPIAARMRRALGTDGYEHRPEQVRMGEEVARTLESRGRLLVEAGTGVGKSFAYLAPAILRCIRRGEKVVIATSTIALQEQLFGKDIPLLAETLGEWDGAESDGVTKLRSDEVEDKPKAGTALLPVLAKGRGNYVSLRRLGLASRRSGMLPDTESVLSLQAIEEWASTTRDGSLSSLPVLARPEVWEHARSDSDNCMGRKCATYQKCFYQSARRELEKANLIVCNHALFFADLALRTRHGMGGERPRDDGDGGFSTTGSELPVPPGTLPVPPRAQTSQIKAILPNYDHVIFDEAHGLEDAASEHFGLSLAMPRVMRLLRTLYSPRRRKGYLLERSLQAGDAAAIDRAITLVGMAERAATEFFEDLLAYWRRSEDGSGRVRRADIVENPLSPAMKELAMCLRRIRDGLEDQNERFELGAFARRASEIAECGSAMVGQTLGADAQGNSVYAYWVEVEGEKRGSMGAGGGQTQGRGVGGDEDEHEESGQGGRGRFGPRVTLACAPIEVAALLRKHLFDPGAEVLEAVVDDGGDEEGSFDALDSDVYDAEVATRTGGEPPVPPKPNGPKRIGIVLTSATLATRQSKHIDEGTRNEARPDAAFAHIIANIGAEGAATLQLGSPFDYRKQAQVIVDLTVPDPKRPANGSASAGPSYADGLAKRVLHHLDATDGGAFVLFTSFATMHACADRLGATLAKRRWALIVHGRDGSRQQMLKRFVEEENGVLFGAASFWQGVDVRGERLRNVIITRLPFEPPDRPLVQARNERIELTGGNPFMQDSLPRAIIRFKQGFGRLIRSKTDRGRVVILDPRVVTARYGRMFLDALPEGIPVEQIRPFEDEYPVDVF